MLLNSFKATFPYLLNPLKNIQDALNVKVRVYHNLLIMKM